MAKSTKAPVAATPNTNGALPEQSVMIDEYNGNRMFNVQNLPFDRFPTSMGARKVGDIVRNIEEALKFLDGGNDQAKQIARTFWSKFQRKTR